MFVKFFFIFVLLKTCSAQLTIGNTTIDVKSAFENGCYKEITEYIKNIEKETNFSNPADVKINVTSVECLMFCGYKKVGIVDNDGNVRMDVLKSMVAPQEATFESGISKCIATEKTTNVCEKALKNVKCIFAEGMKMIGLTQE